MTFSPRATILMARLDQLLGELDAPVARIANDIDARHLTDTEKTMRDINDIDKTSRHFRQFMEDVALGPDAPFDTKDTPRLTVNISWQTLKTKAVQARDLFGEWGAIKNGILKSTSYASQSLYPLASDGNSPRAAQQAASDRIFKVIHGLVNPNAQSDQAEERGGYADIGLRQTDFLNHIHAAHRIILAQRLGRPARFLDVGCGGGLKVMSAAEFFAPSEGFDFVRSYVDAAQPLMRLSGPNAHVFESDGLTFDRYADYDVIYFYRPLKQQSLLEKLEAHIAHSAHPGALLIAPYLTSAHRLTELGCAHVAGRVFIAHTSQEEADDLCQMAERMGPHPRSSHIIAGDSPWQPVVTALERNGFHLQPST